jgi:hypothetical protein
VLHLLDLTLDSLCQGICRMLAEARSPAVVAAGLVVTTVRTASVGSIGTIFVQDGGDAVRITDDWLCVRIT